MDNVYQTFKAYPEHFNIISECITQLSQHLYYKHLGQKKWDNLTF